MKTVKIKGGDTKDFAFNIVIKRNDTEGFSQVVGQLSYIGPDSTIQEFFAEMNQNSKNLQGKDCFARVVIDVYDKGKEVGFGPIHFNIFLRYYYNDLSYFNVYETHQEFKPLKGLGHAMLCFLVGFIDAFSISGFKAKPDAKMGLQALGELKNLNSPTALIGMYEHLGFKHHVYSEQHERESNYTEVYLYGYIADVFDKCSTRDLTFLDLYTSINITQKNTKKSFANLH